MGYYPRTKSIPDQPPFSKMFSFSDVFQFKKKLVNKLEYNRNGLDYLRQGKKFDISYVFCFSNSLRKYFEKKIGNL
jgi:hypothetical protein